MLSSSCTPSDGGGIRGLSELIILREIMERIQFQRKFEELPLPCDYFDMIGGTSTGGFVIAAIDVRLPFSLSPNRFLGL
jgi:patatin-like phospholipase/acyl hydrolase